MLGLPYTAPEARNVEIVGSHQQKMECPSETELLSFVSRDLTSEEADGIHRHLDRCSECRLLVSELALSETLLPSREDGTLVDSPAADAEQPDFILPFRQGDLIAGKYRIDRCVGYGGMGVVYAAHHDVLRNAVALKFLRVDTCGDAAARGRFLREARAAAQLHSEHVVRVFDVGVTENGIPYLVMELLRGVDLSQLLLREKRLPFEEAVRWVVECCEALVEAHARGIVHRDLKPANLFVAEMGSRQTLKVLDFGISKSIAGTTPLLTSGVTTTRAIIGSPLYMSPEQLRGSKAIDTRSDLWSIGAILYELTTGSPPFAGESFGALCMDVASGRVPSIRSVCPDVPKELEETVAACLQVDPGRRIESAADIATRLRRLASSAGSLATNQKQPTRLRLSRVSRRWLLVSALPLLAGAWFLARSGFRGPHARISDRSEPSIALGKAGSQAASRDLLDEKKWTSDRPAPRRRNVIPRAEAPVASPDEIDERGFVERR